MSNSEKFQSKKTVKLPPPLAAGPQPISMPRLNNQTQKSKFFEITKSGGSSGLSLSLAVINLEPLAIKKRFGITFKRAKDDCLGQFQWAVIETAGGNRFGLRQFVEQDSAGTEVLVNEKNCDLVRGLKELQSTLEIAPSDLTWVNPMAR